MNTSARFEKAIKNGVFRRKEGGCTRLKRIVDNTVRNEDGIALVVALLVMLMMTILGTAAIYMASLNVKISGNEKTGMQAYYAAVAGIKDAEKRLIMNTADTRGAGGYLVSDPNWSSTIGGTMPTAGSYSVTLSHVRTSDGSSVLMPAGMTLGVDPPYYRLTATGTSGVSQRQIEKIIYLTFNNAWKRAITACSSVSLEQNVTANSYNSGAGAYGGANIGSQGDVYAYGNVTMDPNMNLYGNVTSTGSVTTANNASITGTVTAGTSVTVAGNSTITGNVISGTTTTLTASNSKIVGNATAGGTVSNNGTITGAITQNASVAPVNTPAECLAQNSLPLPGNISTSNNNAAITCLSGGASNAGGSAVACPAACTATTPTSQCIVSGQTLVLPGSADPANPTKYYFNGLDLSNNSAIRTTGYVQIYVNGDFKQENNSIICGASCGTLSSPGNPLPDQVLVYVYGQSNGNPGLAPTVGMEQNTSLFGKLYAPGASEFQMEQNSNVYGAIIAGGSEFELEQNVRVSFDTALISINKPASGDVVQKLRECPYRTFNAASGEYMTGSCKPN